MPKYAALSPELDARMRREAADGTYARVGFDNARVLRRKHVATDSATIWRPPFVHDIDKIMHCPYYNRYTDKTQVFSLIRNDDITRRSLHVQLVSRIARTIGTALHLNLDLIEAIALGHDIGHPPFAHAGEVYLDEVYRSYTGRRFSHNIHSVRVLDKIFPFNISLQTLSGIAGHNGEIELEEYWPVPEESFEEFDRILESCCLDKRQANMLQPSTLEGNVMRIADIIAYLGKDRQDAARVGIIDEEAFDDTHIGTINAEIINNLIVNIIENSYGKPYIKLDADHFQALKDAKRENNSLIYRNAAKQAKLDTIVRPMMAQTYGQLLDDLKQNRTHSPIFTHHINYVNQTHYTRPEPYLRTEPNQLVVDYIASMTDDYFVDLHHYLFPDSPLRVEYKGYFNEPQEVSHV